MEKITKIILKSIEQICIWFITLFHQMAWFIIFFAGAFYLKWITSEEALKWFIIINTLYVFFTSYKTVSIIRDIAKKEQDEENKHKLPNSILSKEKD